MGNIFTKHPHSIGESYFQHLKFATQFGLSMLIGGIACLIHAFLPFLFKNTGSDLLLKMTRDFVERMPPNEKRVMKLSASLDAKIKREAC